MQTPPGGAVEGATRADVIALALAKGFIWTPGGLSNARPGYVSCTGCGETKPQYPSRAARGSAVCAACHDAQVLALYYEKRGK